MSDIKDQEVSTGIVPETADGNSLLDPAGGLEAAQAAVSGTLGATESISGPSNPNNGGNRASGN